MADGVSGWVEYGFSSMAFSHSLMDKCKEQIEIELKKAQESLESKELRKKLKKTGSHMSMENFDLPENDHDNLSESMKSDGKSQDSNSGQMTDQT